MERPLSVIDGRDPLVLQTMLEFYAWPGAKVLDVTANRRRMWRGVPWRHVMYADIDRATKPQFVADFTAMPWRDDSYDVLVFDPPHLPHAAASPESLGQLVRDYGFAHAPHANNVTSYFSPFLREAARVLRPDGLIFAKLKDFVHNHAYQWTLADFIATVRAMESLTACDLIVKRDPCGGNLKSSKWQRSHHARNAHCWWVVVRKGRCETRRKAS